MSKKGICRFAIFILCVICPTLSYGEGRQFSKATPCVKGWSWTPSPNWDPEKKGHVAKEYRLFISSSRTLRPANPTLTLAPNVLTAPCNLPKSPGQYYGMMTAVATKSFDDGTTKLFESVPTIVPFEVVFELTFPLCVSFQPAGTEVPSGCVVDSGLVGQLNDPLGWVTVPVRHSRMRNIHHDRRLDGFVYVVAQQERTWELKVPNGEYVVTVGIGDASYRQGPHRLLIEGQQWVNDEETMKGQFLAKSLPVHVDDGRLSLTLGGTKGNSLLNYLTVERRQARTSLPIISSLEFITERTP